MVHRTVTMAALAGLVPVVMMTTPVAAQSTPTADKAQVAATTAQPATAPEQAGAPLPGWVDLGPHQEHWFKFKYNFDNSDKDNEPTQAIVTLKMDKAGAGRFEVWTRARLDAPLKVDEDKDKDQGTVREPVGQGTPLKVDEVTTKNDDGTKEKHDVLDATTLEWVGGQKATETFYVRVRNTTDQPVRYTLTISGPDVSY
jgi:hypothetical protein